MKEKDFPRHHSERDVNISHDAERSYNDRYASDSGANTCHAMSLPI